MKFHNFGGLEVGFRQFFEGDFLTEKRNFLHVTIPRLLLTLCSISGRFHNSPTPKILKHSDEKSAPILPQLLFNETKYLLSFC